MQDELDDFMSFCRIERRLAPLTCSAYERDVRVCLAFLRERGIDDLAAVKPADLRAPVPAPPRRLSDCMKRGCTHLGSTPRRRPWRL
jgi:site-specific recombinase XerC